jgi:tRNA 2-thiouridine synthesizing protein A
MNKLGSELMTEEHDGEIDCSGMNCPMPVLKTKLKIDTMGAGQTLRVIATDPGACSDMPAWANRVGHTLVSSGEEEDKFIFYIRKGE